MSGRIYAAGAAPPRIAAPFEGSKHTSAHLDPEDVEAIGRAVARHLAGTEAAGLLTAAELARRLGVSRDTIYRRADELGAIRVGGGRRPRLRFAPDTPRPAGEGSVAAQTPAQSAKSRGRPRPPNGHNSELLPIGPRRGERSAAQ